MTSSRDRTSSYNSMSYCKGRVGPYFPFARLTDGVPLKDDDEMLDGALGDMIQLTISGQVRTHPETDLDTAEGSATWIPNTFYTPDLFYWNDFVTKREDLTGVAYMDHAFELLDHIHTGVSDEAGQLIIPYKEGIHRLILKSTLSGGSIAGAGTATVRIHWVDNIGTISFTDLLWDQSVTGTFTINTNDDFTAIGRMISLIEIVARVSTSPTNKPIRLSEAEQKYPRYQGTLNLNEPVSLRLTKVVPQIFTYASSSGVYRYNGRIANPATWDDFIAHTKEEEPRLAMTSWVGLPGDNRDTTYISDNATNHIPRGDLIIPLTQSPTSGAGYKESSQWWSPAAGLFGSLWPLRAGQEFQLLCQDDPDGPTDPHRGPSNRGFKGAVMQSFGDVVAKRGNVGFNRVTTGDEDTNDRAQSFIFAFAEVTTVGDNPHLVSGEEVLLVLSSPVRDVVNLRDSRYDLFKIPSGVIR